MVLTGLVLLSDQQKTPVMRVRLNQYYLMGTNSELTAMVAFPVSLQKEGKPEEM